MHAFILQRLGAAIGGFGLLTTIMPTMRGMSTTMATPITTTMSITRTMALLPICFYRKRKGCKRPQVRRSVSETKESFPFPFTKGKNTYRRLVLQG